MEEKKLPKAYLRTIATLSEHQAGHLAWRLDHKTAMGMLTAIRIARGDNGWTEKTLLDAFTLGGCTLHSAKCHSRKVVEFVLGQKNYR